MGTGSVLAPAPPRYRYKGKPKAVADARAAAMETAENRVRTEAPFILGAVELNHLLIERALVGGIEIGERVGNLAIHIFHRLENAFAEESLVVTVAQFDGFVLAGGGATGNDRPSLGSVGQCDFGLDRWISS